MMAGDGTTDRVVMNEPNMMRKDKDAFLVASCDFEHLNQGIAASLDYKNMKEKQWEKHLGWITARLQLTMNEKWGGIWRLDWSWASEGLLGSTCTKMRISQERLSVPNSGIYCQVAFAQHYAQSKNRKSRWRNKTDISHRVVLPCVSMKNVITRERHTRTSSFRYPSVGLVE
ncbi:hypothetical protein EDC04DRAFT_1496882 [Pisolithus marmoratus]|nr:hypothetical protein EDC04DRAFT_1496882 [Pisolithus marmoratus]